MVNAWTSLNIVSKENTGLIVAAQVGEDMARGLSGVFRPLTHSHAAADINQNSHLPRAVDAGAEVENRPVLPGLDNFKIFWERAHDESSLLVANDADTATSSTEERNRGGAGCSCVCWADPDGADNASDAPRMPESTMTPVMLVFQMPAIHANHRHSMFCGRSRNCNRGKCTEFE